jgi:hypothetical protein
MMSQGSDDTERGRTKRRSTGGIRRLSFGFGFEWSMAWAGYDGSRVIIFVLVGGFVVKMGYLVLLVSDKQLAYALPYCPLGTYAKLSTR